MKMEMRQQQKQKISQRNVLILVGSTSIIGILIVVLMVTGMFKWEASTGDPSQNQTENLSTFKAGSWSNSGVWNKGLNTPSTSSIFTPTSNELDFNLDQVNYTHSTSSNPSESFSSLKKCSSNKGNPCKGLGQKNTLEFGESVIKTNDGNYAVIGKSNSFNNNGQLYVAKFKRKNNGKFDMLWATQVGNSQQTAAGKAILQNSNDEYIAVGKTKKNNKGVQAYIVKLSKQGQVQWQNTVGGADKDVANDIIQTQSGNYLMTGTSKKWGGNSKGIYCLNFSLKNNGNGIVKNWDHIYGAPGQLDRGKAAAQMAGGGFAVTGYTEYDQNTNQSNGQIFVTRIDNNGQMKWSRTIGNPQSNRPSDILVDQNDDIVITGHSKASINGNDKRSTYTLKLDNSGNLQWDRAIRKYDYESYGQSITLTNSNNNYVISGYSATPNNNKDIYLAKIGTNGNLQWDQLGGSSSNDKAFGITSLSNGKFLTVGRTHSVNNSNGDILVSMVDNNGNVCTGCKGSNNQQVVTKQNLNNLQVHNNRNFRFESKVVSTANQQVNGSSNTSSDCDPCTGIDGGGDEWFNDVIETANGYIYVGRTSSFGSGSNNAYVVKMDQNYNVQWQQMIGSSNGLEEASAIAETSVSDEYIIAGRSKVNSFGNNDIYLVKIKDGGNNASVKWERLIGGPSDESASDLVKLQNDNYVLAGRTTSFVNNSDGVLIRFSLNSFSIDWRKLFGDPNTSEDPKAITSTSPNSVSVVSSTQATNNGGIYLTQFEANGNFKWGRLIGGSNTDKPFGITADQNNHLIITGFSKVGSSNGGTGTKDIYAAKFDNNGNKKWDQLVGNSKGEDKGRDIHTTQNGEYVITGSYMDQNTKEVSFVNLGSNGSIHFSSEFGGQSKDLGHSILQNHNGNFVVAGKTESSKFVSNNNGALVYRIMANGVPTKASGNGGGSGQGPGNGGYNNNNNEVPGKNDIAQITQDVVVRNQNHQVRHLDVKKGAVVRIDSNRSLEIKDTLDLTSGYLSVAHGGELILDHNAAVINMDSANLTGQLSFRNQNNLIDSIVFRLDSANDLKIASVHDFNQGNEFRSYHIEKDPTNKVGTQKSSTLNAISESEFYNIKRDSGSGSCKVTLFWNQNNSTHIQNVANKNELVVAHWNGSKWVDEGNSKVEGDLKGSGYVTSQTVNNFSEWTFGSSGSSPLPVEMTYFRGEKTEQGAQLNWATASETNNSHFEVLRKLPNSDFKQIGEVEGHGQSTQSHQYQFKDRSVEANGTVYYKLKQVDFDGSYEYSQVIAINLQQSSEEDLTIQKVYPNPFEERVKVSFKVGKVTPVKVQLLTMRGQIKFMRTIKANAGENSFTYNQGDQLKPGNYTLILKTEQDQVHKKLIKR